MAPDVFPTKTPGNFVDASSVAPTLVSTVLDTVNLSPQVRTARRVTATEASRLQLPGGVRYCSSEAGHKSPQATDVTPAKNSQQGGCGFHAHSSCQSCNCKKAKFLDL